MHNGLEKTNRRTEDELSKPRARVSSAIILLLPLFFSSCFTSLDTSKRGSESHFLMDCDDACSDDLQCISNLCTIKCTAEGDECARLSKAASCRSDGIEDDGSGVCDVACASSAECKAIHRSLSCENGFCRTLAKKAEETSAKADSGISRDALAESDSGNEIDASVNPADVRQAALADSGDSPSDAKITYEEEPCQLGDQLYPSGTTDIAAPIGCGICDCNDGELSCVENDCPIRDRIVPCSTLGDMVNYPVDVIQSSIDGDTLTLSVRHSGGCAEHDYILCYHELHPDYLSSSSWFYKPDPPYLDTTLIHRANGDQCKALISRTLEFDLAPLGSMMNSLTGLMWGGGGVVQTSFGFYAYGEWPFEHEFDDSMTCERRSLAMEWLASDLRDNSRSCSNDSDCVVSAIETSCYSGCNRAVYSESVRDEFEEQIYKIENSVCGDYEADGCSEKEISVCEDPPPITCTDGKCTAETPELCQLPFDPGPCEGSEYVHTYDATLRACVLAIYHGCEGNENRFDSFQDCESTCSPTGLLPDCPEGRVPIRDCTSAGPIFGCAHYTWLCAKPCSRDDEEDPCAEEPSLGQSSSPLSCIAGFCIMGYWSPV